MGGFSPEDFVNAAVKVALPGNDPQYLDFVSKLFRRGPGTADTGQQEQK